MNELDTRSAREIIFDIFPSIDELPIKGGWGWTQEDAVIIDKNDSIVNSSLPFNGVQIEHTFIEYSNYLHLITYRPLDDRYSGIRYKVLKQSLIHDEKQKKVYDRIDIELTCFTDKDWEELKEEWESNYDNPDFNKEAHSQKRDSKLRSMEMEYWFEISSFY